MQGRKMGIAFDSAGKLLSSINYLRMACLSVPAKLVLWLC